MKYFLWDIGVSKLLAAPRTEPEAVALVRALVDQYGAEYADDLALGIERDDGSPAEPLSGATLLALIDESSVVLAEAARA